MIKFQIEAPHDFGLVRMVLKALGLVYQLYSPDGSTMAMPLFDWSVLISSNVQSLMPCALTFTLTVCPSAELLI